MRRLLGVLKSFWLLSFLLWLIGVALCVWWVPRLGGSPQRLAVAVAILSAVWLLAIVLRKYRKVRAERGLETLVQLEVDREAASAASPSGEYEVLRERLKSALGMLKVRSGRRSTLSELPWYLVVGHSASGKTSLLTRSGLNTSVAGLGAESGTQYCDWYFGTEAVMIDTAGRYIAEEQPAREFGDFLRLLAKRRRQTPINGLVVVVDLAELLHSTREHNYAHAQQLVERIDDYHRALGATPPVYLCFSKADLLPGFVEAFGELAGESRQRPWGMTFPLSEIRGHGVGRAFTRRFTPMVDALRAHVERQLRDQGRQADSTLLRFPDYVAEIEGRLTDFLEPFDLRVNPGSAPLTRGLYFTSALQRGEGLEAVIDDHVSETFALSASDGTAAAQAVAPHQAGAEDPGMPAGRNGVRSERSYFIQGLFHDVIIADRSLVQHQSRDGHRRSVNLWLTAIGALVGVGVLGVLGSAYWYQRETLIRLDEQVGSAAEAPDRDRLALLHRELSRLEREAKNGLPVWQDGGFNVAGGLRPGVEQAYFSALDRQALTPVAQSLRQRLDAIGELAGSLGLDPRVDYGPTLGGAIDGRSDADADASIVGQGQEALAERRDSMRDRLTSRPALGSVPRSPGELASRLRGEADYRLRGSVNDAYWGVRQEGRDALREGARDAWRSGLDGLANSGPAVTEDGPAISQAALNQLEPAQVAELIDAYDALKLYLVLTAPDVHPEADFVREALPAAWQRLARRDPRVNHGAAAIRDNVALYANYLEQGKVPALVRDERMVARARANLKAFLIDNSPADREYLRLRLAAQAQFPALTLADILPKASQPAMYAGEAVPAFFTHRVWQEFVSPELRKTLASDLKVERDWVLDGDSNEDDSHNKAQFAQAVMARYKRDYIFAWERFLTGVGVRRFEGLEESRQHLTQLSDYQRSPIKSLLQMVDANTRWDSVDAERRSAGAAAPGGDGDDAPQDQEAPGFWQSTVDWVSQDGGSAEASLTALSDMPSAFDGVIAGYFEPVNQLFDADVGSGEDATQMDRYLLLLRQLKVRLDSLERGDLGKRTKQLVEDVVEGRPNEITALRNYVAANIDTSRDELVQSLQRLFRAPVEYSVSSLNGPIAIQLAAAWGDQIAVPWNSMVGGRYPVSDSANEASVRDLRRFVDPQSGMLTRFDETEVGSLADARSDGEPLVDPRITSTITDGTGVGDVLASLGDVENGFEIMIQPAPNLTSIRLTIDGQEQVYRNGQQSWQRFTWPGEPREAGARLDIVTYGGQRVTVFDFPSRWGLLRMIDSADVTNLDGVRQRFTWYTGAGPVSFTARNFGGVKLTDLEQVRRLRIPTLGAR
ncbi:type VI secretion protein IcmF/TssM N-terminal domain-containing protein [Halomonas sp. V046]|uniref:type VI secretion protein IcmF/TssM N-terminal domain-containing protein n=1 Tax=Halomonas sp. V046 TaxID=3459611 RepID=UPI004043C5EB